MSDDRCPLCGMEANEGTNRRGRRIAKKKRVRAAMVHQVGCPYAALGQRAGIGAQAGRRRGPA